MEMVKIHLAKASEPRVPRMQWAIPVTLGYAAILVAMSLLQLFGLEEFMPIIQNYWLPGGASVAAVVGSVIIVMQVFSLPFLLRMPLSRLMRLLSAGLSVAVPLVWLALAVYAQVNGYVLENSGMLGEKIAVPTGLAQLALSGVLLAWSLLAVYGLSSRGVSK